MKKLLAKDSPNKARIGKRMFLFWGSGNRNLDRQVEEGMSQLLDVADKKTKADNPGDKTYKVNKLFKAIFSGEIKTGLDDRFHILGLAPNVGRIAVVMWMDCPLKQFAANITSHFNDMEIADSRKEDNRRPYFGVYSMVSSVTLGGKPSDSLSNLIEGTVSAVINGTLYPVTLYTGALERIRAELSNYQVTIQRAAILKAYLNRKSKFSNNKQLSIMLDKNNSNPGYLCGRLAAVLEKVQENVNSGDSIRTRYMAAASSNPATVFPAMLNVSVHHSEKLDDRNYIYFEKLKQEIIDKLPASGFPAFLNLDDQGRFFVGYYHQRTEFFTPKDNKE